MKEISDTLILNGEKVSADTLKSRNEPPKKKRKKWWLRLLLSHPILAYVVIVGGAGAFLSKYWKPIDRYFPALNELIHSNVADQSDINYEVYKLKQSEQAYTKGIEVCNLQTTSLAACRSAYLASESALADISNRVGKLDSAWQNELDHRAMPDLCRQAGSNEYHALDQYVVQEQRVMAVMKAVDPKSPANVARMKEQLSSIGPAEVAAVATVTHLPPWPKQCAGY